MTRNRLQHFLRLTDLPVDDLQAIVRRAIVLKKEPGLANSQARKSLGLIFEKASTRTRVAFEVAMAQLDGNSVFLTNEATQLGRGEPVADTARVLSSMVDCLAIRTFSHDKLEEFSRHSSVPVINALSNDFHPCQLLADIQTFLEHRGEIRGAKVAWIGDGNNMCNSYINAAAMFDFQLSIACPAGFEPAGGPVGQHLSRVRMEQDPVAAVKNADLVVTDVWASMGQEQEQRKREQAFAGFQVTRELMSHAARNALFMHCLPAHRGEEVSAEVLEAADSVVWDEAENRMHTQKALLEYLLQS